MEIITVRYKADGGPKEEVFTSEERLQEWIENYSEFEILSIEHESASYEV